MADEILISTKIDVNYQQAEKDLINLQRKLDRLTDKREVTMTLRDEASDRAFALRDQLMTAQKALEESMAEMQMKYGKEMFAPPNVQAKLEAQRNTVAELQKEFDRAKAAVDRYDNALNKGNVEIEQMNEKAQKMRESLPQGGAQYGLVDEYELKDSDAKSMQRMAGATDRAGESLRRASSHARTFGVRIKNLVKGAFVFNIISMGLRAVRQWFSQVIQANDATAGAFANLKGSLMAMIQPLINTLLPVIQTVLNALTKIASFIGTILATLFGSSFQASVSGASAMNDAVNGVGSGLGTANDEAKKLKKTLAGFDELTILEQPDEASGGGGGGGVVAQGAAFDFANWDLDFSDFFDASEMEAIRKLGETIRDIFKEIWDVIGEIVDLVIEWAKDIDFTPVLESISRLFESIWSVVKPMLETFKKVWEKFIGPILKRFVEDWLPRIIDSFSEMNEALGKVNEVMEPIISTLAEVLEPVFELIFEIFTRLIEHINGTGGKALEFIAKILEKIAPLLEWVFKILGPIIEVIMTIIDLIIELSDTVSDTLWFVLNLIIDLITGDMDAAKEDFNTYMGEMGEHLQKFKELFQQLWDKVKAVWEGIKNAAISAWNAIKGVWQTVSTWFQNTVINPLVNAWKTATSKIGQFFTNIWEGIKRACATAMNAVIGGLESAINWCVDAINSLISGINWVIQGIGKLFGASWGGIGYVGHVYLGRIGLAEGTVVPPNKEFLAMLGDNKNEPEVVSPLSTMKQAMMEAMREAGFSGELTINTYLDGRKIAENTSKYQMQASRAMGV